MKQPKETKTGSNNLKTGTYERYLLTSKREKDITLYDYFYDFRSLICDSEITQDGNCFQTYEMTFHGCGVMSILTVTLHLTLPRNHRGIQ
ncbi:hypothetical protein CEXT_420141 [Caerostris extrusa]|uniref:Uncharacterized protein n=1 Tax=Caerostris extrusa TaxID=172846 RepID=A0AAV4TQJ2_CAEEX|nr:hypothetical protein CEXT_420141 [Caerostris extrusa]